MFGLFKKKDKTPPLGFDIIGVDMHSHILPGIDDGAQNVQDSIVLVKELMSLGIKKLVVTPHVMFDYYRNTPQTINAALDILKAELVVQGINIPVQAAAEYLFDEAFIELIEKGGFLTFGDKHILVEFSFINPPAAFIMALQKLKDMGCKPILAHPERYLYYQLEEIQNLKDWGFLLQMNTISLTGYYGKETKKMAEQMVDNNLVDFISSDMHNLRHAEALMHSLQMPHLQKLLRSGTLKNSSLL